MQTRPKKQEEKKINEKKNRNKNGKLLIRTSWHDFFLLVFFFEDTSIWNIDIGKGKKVWHTKLNSNRWAITIEQILWIVFLIRQPKNRNSFFFLFSNSKNLNNNNKTIYVIRIIYYTLSEQLSKTVATGYKWTLTLTLIYFIHGAWWREFFFFFGVYSKLFTELFLAFSQIIRDGLIRIYNHEYREKPMKKN